MIFPVFHGVYPLFVLLGIVFILHKSGFTLIDDGVETRSAKRELIEYLTDFE